MRSLRLCGSIARCSSVASVANIVFGCGYAALWTLRTLWLKRFFYRRVSAVAVGRQVVIRGCACFWGRYEKNASPASPASPAGKKRQQLRAKMALPHPDRKRQTRHQRVTNASPDRVSCRIVRLPHCEAYIIMLQTHLDKGNV